MKRKLLFAAALTSVILGTGACAGKTTVPAETTVAETTTAVPTTADTETTAAETTAAESSAEETTAVEADAKTSDISEQDEAVIREMAKEVQSVIGDLDMAGLSQYAVYPCYVGVDEGVIVETADDFALLDGEKVLTPEMIEAVETADIDTIQLVEAGFVVGAQAGTPNLIFGVGIDGIVGITGVNP